jgi:hypothetical protein
MADQSNEQTRELTADEMDLVNGAALRHFIRRVAPVIGKIAQVSTEVPQDAPAEA